jgi:hypothetical protein
MKRHKGFKAPNQFDWICAQAIDQRSFIGRSSGRPNRSRCALAKKNG